MFGEQKVVIPSMLRSSSTCDSLIIHAWFSCLSFGEEQTKLSDQEGQLRLDKLDNITCD